MARSNYILWLIFVSALSVPVPLPAQDIPITYIDIDVTEEKSEISQDMYGIFFEDINRSADGGLYAELIFNRGFEEKNLPSSCTYNPDTKRVYAPYRSVYSSPQQMRSWSIPWDIEDRHPGWSVRTSDGTSVSVDILDTDHLGVEASKVMRLTTDKYSSPFRLVNTGFYGLAVKAGEKYDLRLYVKAAGGYSGSVTAEILSSDDRILNSKRYILKGDGEWKYFEGVMIPSETVNDGKFALKFDSPGILEVDYVSLFPKETFHCRPNGLRKDVAQFVADLKPAFIRWPGGCIVEGLTMENRVNWKNTIGKPELRKGEYNLWGYHSTNGFGYHEFLQYCEDIGAKSMFVCNAGMSCDGRNGDYYDDVQVEQLIQDALDAIEYANGDARTTKWGAERAKNGHSEPFGLDFIEIGNENHSPMYAKYYNRFYKRIREAYPDISIITCLPMSDQLEWIDGYDMNDPHFYNFPSWFYSNTDYFDKFPREEGHKVYVGEYACNMGVGAGNMEGALSEGAFMMGMERNSDLVVMSSYAPLMENTKCRMGVNLILVQNDDVIGRSSYWVERMFTDNRPDVNLAVTTSLGLLPDKTTPRGGIGLGTYQTAAEFSNIRITVDGDPVYASDIEANPDEWTPTAPGWKIENGKLIQPDANATSSIMLDGQFLDATKSKIISVEFDAKKLGGKEGFVLHFGTEDVQNCYQMTLGSFGNVWTIFQSVTNGNAFVLNTDRPTFPIETGRKYHVKLVIRDSDILECWVDGKLNLKYDNTYVQRQYAIAGLDRENGEVIVKVINAEDVPMLVEFNFRNAEFEPLGKKISLWADSKYDENTFENRNKIVPVEDVFNHVSNQMNVTFRPQSMTVLRLKIKDWKK